MKFVGDSYNAQIDDARLTSQLDRILALMIDGIWRTLSEIELATGAPAASASAQLRHIRHRTYIVKKRVRGDRSGGLYEYCVLPPLPKVAVQLSLRIS
jgi:hypothetical protein